MLVYQGVPTPALPNLVCQPENQRGHKVFLPRKVLTHEMRNITPQLSTQNPQTKDGFPQMRCKHLASLRSFNHLEHEIHKMVIFDKKNRKIMFQIHLGQAESNA